MLRRRPDVRQAESQLIAANAQIGVATANLYPQILLTAGLGYQGQGLGRTPVSWDSIWSVGPAVRWPLLDFGSVDAAIQAQDYQTRALAINYRKTVVLAMEEVDNGLERLRCAAISAGRFVASGHGRPARGFIGHSTLRSRPDGFS